MRSFHTTLKFNPSGFNSFDGTQELEMDKGGLPNNLGEELYKPLAEREKRADVCFF